MIRSAISKQSGSLRENEVVAVDGELGPITDLLFDDHAWTVRYLVVKVEAGLASHETVISPVSVSGADRQLNSLYMDLTREKAQQAPYLEANLPVGAQQEAEYRTYLDVDPYWTGDWAAMPPVVPAAGLPPLPYPISEADIEERAPGNLGGDPRLRSAGEVAGYRIETSDNAVGHMEDLLLDDETWELRYIVVDTRNWMPAKKVLLPLDFISEMRWATQSIAVDLTSQRLKDAPAWDPQAPLDHDYETRLREHYGHPSQRAENYGRRGA